MKQRILYIPGLGDGYDPIRRLGLLTWRRHDIAVELVPMCWRDSEETFEQKLERIEKIIKQDQAPITLVGESAGGAMAIVATQRFTDRVAGTITLCGMNQGADNVNPRLYQHNPAFREAMGQSDLIVGSMDQTTKEKMIIMYSSKDFRVRPKHTLVEGVQSVNLKTPGHLTSILLALFFRGWLVHHFVTAQNTISRS